MTDRNPIFANLMRELIDLHDKKSRDYAKDDNVYSNFEFAAQFADVSVYQTFMILLGIKAARINELLSGKIPNNESLLDSMKDFTTYAGIMTSYYISHDNPPVIHKDSYHQHDVRIPCETIHHDAVSVEELKQHLPMPPGELIPVSRCKTCDRLIDVSRPWSKKHAGLCSNCGAKIDMGWEFHYDKKVWITPAGERYLA